MFGVDVQCGVNKSGDRRGLDFAHGETRGGARSPEYRAWQSMRARCYTATTKNYQRYGGRGIRVCDRWLESFENFLADMGRRPSPQHSLDRKDNDGNYEPSNCRWATKAQQSTNKSDTRMLTAFGRTMCIQDWARETGVEHRTIRARLRLGWDVERALSRQVR